ncbi:DUF4932 domain-containing protein [Candidatus Uabimicrobium sp. HlEnr_7]|uniref:DUF4932 domain-containing protein n=1 Tax=Candidatus Uabimicrobium helgolandensis TaxID=3095367 RepID=UPI003557B974
MFTPKSIFLVLTIIFMLANFELAAQEKTILQPPKVDKRVELLGIVFRLAGSSEYSSKLFPKYVEKIEKHFSKYKNHELISFTKNELRKKGVSFDAVMSMAVRISNPPQIKLLPFSEETIDKRWNKSDMLKFVDLLNDFYEQANCQVFFSKNEVMYKLASERYSRVYKKLDLNWYSSFYGTAPKAKFTIVNGLGNGSGNYGPHVKLEKEKEIIYAITGVWKVDDSGMPKYKFDEYFPTLLHEFNHSFVNPTIIQHQDALEKSGKVIFKHVKNMMERIGYGNWRTMYFETLVRACVIKYLKDHSFDEDYVKERLNHELAIGFLWTEELIAELERYDQNRKKYPTLESFIPELVIFFSKVSSNFSNIEANFDKKRPKILQLKPFKNGSQLVVPNTKILQIYFNKKMRGSGFNYGQKGESAFPNIKNVTYSEDRMSVNIEMALQANKDYQMVLWGAFRSEEGFPLKDFEIHFKTVDFPDNN